jgi:hypothetical protein
MRCHERRPIMLAARLDRAGDGSRHSAAAVAMSPRDVVRRDAATCSVAMSTCAVWWTCVVTKSVLAVMLTIFSMVPVNADGQATAVRQPPQRNKADDELTRLTNSAEQSDVRAASVLCELYSGSTVASYHGPDVTENDALAARWCQAAASRGDIRASELLASLFYFGKGVPKDYAQTARWIRGPANAGESEAQYLLGLLYLNAWGVARNDVEGFAWMLKSAEQGYASAHPFVATLFFTGRGTMRDPIEGLKWLTICAARETDAQQQCQTNRDVSTGAMTRADVAEAQRRADEWFRTCRRAVEPRRNMICE